MADTIIRLKVESTEYEGKIKRAVQGLQQLEKHVREMGAGFEVAEKADLEFVRALGQMETKATSSTGKLAELKSAFVELSVQYKNLSDAEKKGEFGVALNKSLGQLKVRIDDLGSQIKEANTDINGMGGILDAVAGKLGVPVEIFTKLGAAAAGIGAALKVATDALKKNEEFMDEWGRITESASSIYDGFLNALNTGNFGTFFSNMDRIVMSARAAYDALDELGTFQAFNQINELNARADLNNAIASYREGTGSKAAVSAAGDNMIAQLEQRYKLQNDTYLNEIVDIAETHTVDPEMLQKALSGKYGDYASLKELSMPTKSVWNSSTRTFNDVIDYDAATEAQKLGAMLRKFTDDELGALQKLGADAANTKIQISGVHKELSRIIKATDEGGTIVNADEVLPEGSIAAIRQRISELNKSLEMAGDQSTRDKIKAQINDLRAELKEMTDSPLSGQNSQVIPLSVELLDTSTEQLTEEVNALREKLGMQPIEIGITTNGKGGSTVDTAKQTEQAWSAAANAVQAVGGALQQIEDPSAKVAGIVMQAVANIALAFSQASVQAAAGGPFAWIAATVSGIATMASAIAAIKSATAGNYADGGIIPGNNYSGDMLTANVNSGELILNRAQQNSIASQLEGSNVMGNIHLTATITGRDILLAASNYARSISKHSGTTGKTIGLPIIS